MTFRYPNEQYYLERIPLSQNIEYRVRDTFTSGGYSGTNPCFAHFGCSCTHLLSPIMPLDCMPYPQQDMTSYYSRYPTRANGSLSSTLGIWMPLAIIAWWLDVVKIIDFPLKACDWGRSLSLDFYFYFLGTLFGQQISSHNIDTHQCGLKVKCHMCQCSHHTRTNRWKQWLVKVTKRGKILDLYLLSYVSLNPYT